MSKPLPKDVKREDVDRVVLQDNSRFVHRHLSLVLVMPDRGIVVKQYRRGEVDRVYYKREVEWLGRLVNWDRVPDLLWSQDSTMTICMTYTGVYLRANNLPKDWRGQTEEILTGLDRYRCYYYNPFYTSNITVKDGRLYLIDIASCHPGKMKVSAREGFLKMFGNLEC